jgi:D-methionine transport system substrate-binding protein
VIAYVQIVFVLTRRRDHADEARIKRYIEIYPSLEVREFVLARFNGTILPTW